MDSTDPRLGDLDRILRDSERTMRELEQAMQELSRLTGMGESRAGTVTARVDAESRPIEVRISNRAMRLDPDELGQHVVEAVRAAQEDHERRARELMPFSPAAPDPSVLGTFRRDLDEMQDSFRREMGERMDDVRRRRQDDY
ncbi:YbaB/EbfC family nucleoid-associated protein [Nonomuraea rhodomycinica]|uniref:YbaB/EbfC family nucleoid-associated protein n=1 Tax=Nonomuraea rhodomycinica TaxID=1712872 RepID=A0A7Y6IMK3_9ACTN|nr:YbaB/EbfC family nucleoid-associated protein [Nonomuraea rhodomycinica]NUW40947.1 YbaB/EbfC family nucleoid-associated protein [Nonomuraea rhodomycinica]